MIRVERLKAAQWCLLKEVRCRALTDAPYAFSTTLEEAQLRPDEEWVMMAARMATDAWTATFIAYRHDEPCGMMGCYFPNEQTEIANLVSVWVAPEVRGQKVAQALLVVTEQWAQSAGARILHAWVAEKNTAALRFYENSGFHYTDQREPFKPDPSQQIILMEHDLSLAE